MPDAGAADTTVEDQTVKSVSVDDAAIQLAYANSVIVVPGYGMAVAQAQHQVRELAEQIEKRGGEVKFAIHPVAGRMPGHMNVLLAEANVPYDKLSDMDEINDEFTRADVALVDRRQRRGQPGRPQRRVEPDLRHADPQRRPGQEHHRAQAQHEPRLLADRERAVLRSEVRASVRRRQEFAVRSWSAAMKADSKTIRVNSILIPGFPLNPSSFRTPGCTTLPPRVIIVSRDDRVAGVEVKLAVWIRVCRNVATFLANIWLAW